MENKLTRKYGFTIFNNQPEESIEYAASNGLRHIELNLSKDLSILETFTPNRIRKIKRLTIAGKVKLSFHLPFTMNVSEIISPYRKNSINYFKYCISLAKKLGATHITIHAGNFFWFPSEKYMRQKALKRFVKSMAEVVSDCENSSVKIALENVVPIPQGSEYLLLGDNIEDFKYIFSQIQSSALRFCLDTGHANMGEGVLPYINNLYDKLICIHYHDNNGNNDEHLPVGSGNINWTNFAQCLMNVKFGGPLISECRNTSPIESANLLQNYFDMVVKNEEPLISYNASPLKS